MVVALVVGIVVAVVAVVLVYAIHSGLFHKLTVTTGAPPIGQFTGAYKHYRGPYRNAGPTFRALGDICPDRKCFGIWYDDPEATRGLEAGPFIDVYDRAHIVSHFMAPLELHERFYVPEVKTPS